MTKSILAGTKFADYK